MTILTIKTFDPSHDMNGNPTAHWNAYLNGELIASSGKRRQQIGYNGRLNMAAAYALREHHGIVIDDKNKRFERDGGEVEYMFHVEE